MNIVNEGDDCRKYKKSVYMYNIILTITEFFIQNMIKKKKE